MPNRVRFALLQGVGGVFSRGDGLPLIGRAPAVTVLPFGHGRMPPSGAVANWWVYAKGFLGFILFGVGSQT